MVESDNEGLEQKEWTQISYKIPIYLRKPVSKIIKGDFGGVMANYLTHVLTRDVMFRSGLASSENPELEKFIREIVRDEITIEVATVFHTLRNQEKKS